jgi:hypothetical protein
VLKINRSVESQIVVATEQEAQWLEMWDLKTLKNEPREYMKDKIDVLHLKSRLHFTSYFYFSYS